MEIKEATMGVVRDFSVMCPHCHKENHGWVSDPRGSKDVYQCDYCDGEFTISPHMDFEMF